MKKVLTVLVLLAVMFSFGSVSLADSCGCGCENCLDTYRQWLMATTLIVADNDGSYDVQVNARAEPDINSEDVGTVYGGTRLNVTELYFTDDGRVWAEIWYGSYGVAYISMKYMQPTPEGTYFYLLVDTDVLARPDWNSRTISSFYGDQLIIAEEIVSNSDGFWVRVRADGKDGYVSLAMLEPVV